MVLYFSLQVRLLAFLTAVCIQADGSPLHRRSRNGSFEDTFGTDSDIREPSYGGMSDLKYRPNTVNWLQLEPSTIKYKRGIRNAPLRSDPVMLYIERPQFPREEQQPVTLLDRGIHQASASEWSRNHSPAIPGMPSQRSGDPQWPHSPVTHGWPPTSGVNGLTQREGGRANIIVGIIEFTERENDAKSLTWNRNPRDFPSSRDWAKNNHIEPTQIELDFGESSPPAWTADPYTVDQRHRNWDSVGPGPRATLSPRARGDNGSGGHVRTYFVRNVPDDNTPGSAVESGEPNDLMAAGSTALGLLMQAGAISGASDNEDHSELIQKTLSSLAETVEDGPVGHLIALMKRIRGS